MESVWNNQTRFGAIHSALGRMAHDQVALGLGFKLQHNPTSCARCKAYIATLELDAIMKQMEQQLANKEEEEGESRK